MPVVESSLSWSSTSHMVEREKEETGREERKEVRRSGGKSKR